MTRQMKWAEPSENEDRANYRNTSAKMMGGFDTPRLQKPERQNRKLFFVVVEFALKFVLQHVFDQRLYALRK
jgi:hypothetical protein